MNRRRDADEIGEDPGDAGRPGARGAGGVSRRAFLAGAAALAAAAASWLAWDNRVGIRNLVGYVPMERRIHEAFPALDLDPEGVRAFVRDYEAWRGPEGRTSWIDPSIPLTYLLSTDHFASGARAGVPVRYVRLYDPYVSPCWNPCATLAFASRPAA